MEIMSIPIGSILTSVVPSTSPTNSSPLPPRRTRSWSPSCSQVSSIQEEVLTDSEVFRFSPMVDPSAPSPQNCSRNATKPESPVKITATMDWREAEKIVVDKCKDLQTKLNLYTLNDIHGHYDEVRVEFYQKLDVMQDSYCEADESILRLLLDYDDAIPTQTKEYWNKQATEILHLLKSHERQLRAAVTRVKENITAPACNASVSGESTSSELARGKRKEALSMMKTNEESIESDGLKLQENIYRGRDWKFKDVSIRRVLKMAEKWDKDLEKIVQIDDDPTSNFITR